VRALAALLVVALLSSSAMAQETTTAALSRVDLERALVLTEIDRARCVAINEVLTSTTVAPVVVREPPWWAWTMAVVGGVALGVATYLGADRLLDEVVR